MSNEQHTIVVPNWIWEWAQEKYDMKNPATPLRNLLSETVAEQKNLPMTPPINEKEKDEKNKNEEDRGTLFKAERDGLCYYCNRTFDAGSNIVGQYKKYYHPKCFDKKQDEENVPD